MKIITSLTLSLVFLLSFFSCNSDLTQEDNLTSTKENTNKSSLPMIGFEFETSIACFYYDENNKAKFFNKRDIISRNDEDKFEVQTDFLPNSTKRLSEIEIVTDPIPFNANTQATLTDISYKIQDLLLELEDSTFNRHLGIEKYAKDDDPLVPEDFGILNLINDTHDNPEYRSNYFDDFTVNITDNFQNIGDLKANDSYVFSRFDEAIIISPQVTLPLSFNSILTFLEDLSNEKEIFDELDFSFKSNTYFTTHLLKYEWGQASFKEFLEGENLKPKDTNLKGFIYLLYHFVYNFHVLGSQSSLKNGCPGISPRNNFSKIFSLLPSNLQSELKKDNGKLLLQILEKLFNSQISRYNDFDVNSPLFKAGIYQESVEKSRIPFPHLSIKLWISELIKGNDLLIIKNQQEFFSKEKVNEDDIRELKNAYNYFGNHTEMLNGIECGIYEIRTRPDVTLRKNAISYYVYQYLGYLYEITH